MITTNEPQSVSEMMARYAAIRKRVYETPRRKPVEAIAPPPPPPKPVAPKIDATRQKVTDEIAALQSKRDALIAEMNAVDAAQVKAKTILHLLNKEAKQLETKVKKLKEVVYLMERQPISKFRILLSFSRATGFSVDQIQSMSRPRDLVLVRQACMYWMARRTNSSLPEIARCFGDRDHTTVMHAVRVYPGKRKKMGRHVRNLNTSKSHDR